MMVVVLFDFFVCFHELFCIDKAILNVSMFRQKPLLLKTMKMQDFDLQLICTFNSVEIKDCKKGKA